MSAQPKLDPPKEYGFHELSNVFPLIEGAEFDALVDDIRVRGLVEMIVIYEDQILDGRNRYRACIKAEVTPKFRPYDGDDPLAEVLSRNLKRRHLTIEQRAMVAARLANMSEGRPKETASFEAVSQKEAANRLQISRSTVQRAKTVLDSGAPELVKAVETGAVKLAAATVLAKAPPERQQVVVAGGKKAVAAAVKELKQVPTEQADQFDLHLAIMAVMHSLRGHVAKWPKAHRMTLSDLAKELRTFADTLDKRAIK